jgi:hypothetical protein
MGCRRPSNGGGNDLAALPEELVTRMRALANKLMPQPNLQMSNPGKPSVKSCTA